MKTIKKVVVAVALFVLVMASGNSFSSESLIISGGINMYEPAPIGQCYEAWDYHAGNARTWFEKMGYPPIYLANPKNGQSVQDAIIGANVSVIFETAHSNSWVAFAGCEGEYILATDLPKVDFMYNRGCGSVCETADGTYASRAKSLVGFCGLADAVCYDCLQSSGRFQDALFASLYEGNTVGDAFNQSLLVYPECQNCAGFLGDGSIKIYNPPATCGSLAKNYLAREEDWPAENSWCGVGSSGGGAFPEKGGVSNWNCFEEVGGTVADCTATRNLKDKGILSYMPGILVSAKIVKK